MISRIATANLAAVAIAASATLAPEASARYLPHADSVHREALQQQAGGPTLTTWSHAYKKGVRNYKYVMVGTDPATGSATTTVPVYIIPVIVKFYNEKPWTRPSPARNTAPPRSA